NRQLSTTKLVRLPSREDLAEMAVAAGSREPAPLAPGHCTPQALPSASASNCPSGHHHERGSPMKNRKPEIFPSASVRGEDRAPPPSTRPPKFSPSRSGCCRAAGRVAHRVGASLSDAAGAPDRWISGGGRGGLGQKNFSEKKPSAKNLDLKEDRRAVARERHGLFRCGAFRSGPCATPINPKIFGSGLPIMSPRARILGPLTSYCVVNSARSAASC